MTECDKNWKQIFTQIRLITLSLNISLKPETQRSDQIDPAKQTTAYSMLQEGHCRFIQQTKAFTGDESREKFDGG